MNRIISMPRSEAYRIIAHLQKCYEASNFMLDGIDTYFEGDPEPIPRYNFKTQEFVNQIDDIDLVLDLVGEMLSSANYERFSPASKLFTENALIFKDYSGIANRHGLCGLYVKVFDYYTNKPVIVIHDAR